MMTAKDTETPLVVLKEARQELKPTKITGASAVDDLRLLDCSLRRSVQSGLGDFVPLRILHPWDPLVTPLTLQQIRILDVNSDAGPSCSKAGGLVEHRLMGKTTYDTLHRGWDDFEDGLKAAGVWGASHNYYVVCFRSLMLPYKCSYRIWHGGM